MSKQKKIETIRNNVRVILEAYPDSRNCDIKLYELYLCKFHSDVLSMSLFGNSLPLRRMHKVPAHSYIARCRRLIQSSGLCVPTDKSVAKLRRMDMTEWAVLMTKEKIKLRRELQCK